MNITNKLTMIHGWGGAYVGDVPSQVLSDGTVIPAMNMHDGPQGVANGNTDVTCWPSALTVVQSWDPELMAEYGAGMGLEQVRIQGALTRWTCPRWLAGGRVVATVPQQPFCRLRRCVVSSSPRVLPPVNIIFYPSPTTVQEGHELYAGPWRQPGTRTLERPQLVRRLPSRIFCVVVCYFDFVL